MTNLTSLPLLAGVWFVVVFLLMIQLRGIHFFTVHRGIHPWWSVH